MPKPGSGRVRYMISTTRTITTRNNPPPASIQISGNFDRGGAGGGGVAACLGGLSSVVRPAPACAEETLIFGVVLAKSPPPSIPFLSSIVNRWCLSDLSRGLVVRRR